MKFYLLVLISIVSITSFSQTAPPFINYQGVARNASGVPITNATNPNISIKFEIYPSQTATSFSFSEIQQNIPLSSLGLFSTKIGAVNNLNSINWSTGSWYLEVFIDLNNGNNPTQSLGRQQLISVPYALFADKAGSAPAPNVTFTNNILSVGGNTAAILTTTYTAGNGINITSGVISNTLASSNTTVTGTNNAIVTNPSSNIYNVAVKAQTLTIVPGDTLKSTLGGSVLLPRTTITASTNIGLAGNPINGYTISNIAPGSSSTSLVAGNTNIQLIPGLNSYTLNSHSYNLSNSSNTLTLQNSPGSVSNTVVMPLTTISPSNGIGVTGSPLSGYVITNTATPSISFTSATVGTLNSGAGTSSTFTIPSPVLSGGTGIAIGGTWPNQTISALSTGSTAAWSTLGNTGTNPPSNFLGTTDNKEIVFKTNNNQHAVITTSGNVGIGIPIPLAKLDVSAVNGPVINASLSGTGNVITANTSGAGTVINANTSGAGIGINVNATTGTAINTSNNGPLATINASNISSGPAITSTANVGSALIASNNSATAPAVIITNTSSASGAIALNVTSANTGTGQVALQLNNGHLKSTGTTPSVSIVGNGLGGFTPTASITPQSTDMKGTITVSIPSFTGASPLGFVDVNVVFNKQYNTGTTVLLTPVEPSRFSYIVTAQNGGNFTVKIINNNSVTASFVAGFNFLRFNYFVIE